MVAHSPYAGVQGPGRSPAGPDQTAHRDADEQVAKGAGRQHARVVEGGVGPPNATFANRRPARDRNVETSPTNSGRGHGLVITLLTMERQVTVDPWRNLCRSLISWPRCARLQTAMP